MLMPSIFGENLFDDFFNDFPFYDDKAGQKIEKKLYGRHGQNLMKTDIKEMEDGYELEMDLPGFKKEEISISLEDGNLTIQAAKGFAFFRFFVGSLRLFCYFCTVLNQIVQTV